MARKERTYMGILGILQRLLKALEINKDELSHLEPFRIKLAALLSAILEITHQQSALRANQCPGTLLQRLPYQTPIENPNISIDRAVDDGVGKAAEWVGATLVIRRGSDIWELLEDLHNALKLLQKPSGDAASCLRLVKTECVGQVPLGAAM